MKNHVKHRLHKITTKIGDSGTTRLADNSSIAKDSNLIEAIGAIDELNAVLGMLSAALKESDNFHISDNQAIYKIIKNIQQHLFDIGAELATQGNVVLKFEKVEYLEPNLQEINQQLPPLKEFVVPGEDMVSSTAHFARSVARRAERRIVTVLNTNVSFKESEILKYINRLSDFLFVISRQVARSNNQDEAQWNNPYRT